MTSELDDLRAFMEQRFTAALPDVDTSPGSAVDIAIITPLINRLAPDPYDTPIEDFLRARMKSEYPDLVLQKGEPIDDFAVKPNRIFLEPFRRQITAVTRNQSIQDPTVLNDREADALAANYFSKRRLGGYAVGVARLYFTQPRFVLIQPTNAVFTSTGLRFLPVESQSISADDMIFNQSGNLYYFDVVARAENQGSDYNIERNTLIGIENVPSVVKVQNRTRFEEGAPRETTEEFLVRVEQELTEKSLVTFRGIRARILELFESVRSISVIGYNDPEMNRDIVTGAPGATYAYGNMTAQTGSSSIYTTVGAVTNGAPGANDFFKIGVEVGDAFRWVDLANFRIRDFRVTEVISNVQVRVTPAPPTLVTPSPFMIVGPHRGSIFLSDIPGGIVQPQTPQGEIIVANNQVHIGGAYDVYVRAGELQDRTIVINSVNDASPLHFGVDLESFGSDADEFVQITDPVEDAATTDAAFTGPGDLVATIYVRVLRVDGTVPWYPSATDVGRYLELLGTNGAGTDYGLYEIMSVGAEMLFGGARAVPIVISTFDEHTQTNTVGITDRSSAYDLDFRLVESISVKSRVRDRSNPQADFNGNNNGLGSEVGDSIVVENGPDAGIYTIRKILTAIGEDDTLVLDRELTNTQTPTGAGDGSGLRYRLADEIQVDLVSPRVTKMPLGAIFTADDLQTVASNPTATSSGSSNFILAGVEEGDTLEILEGDNKGIYEIATPITTNQVNLVPSPQTTGFNQTFAIYRAYDGIQRPIVRVASVELLDSAEQPTGINVPYGAPVDIRVLGTLSNRAGGLNVESYLGEIVNVGSPLLVFQDLNVDFSAQGVVPGNRLEILEGDSIGEYEIAQVAPGGNVNRVVVHGDAVGGKDFVSPVNELHYRIGEPSAGIARVYFVEPTSAEVLTGRMGGRLSYQFGNQDLRFRYSRVHGRTILPAPASEDADPRGIKVVRSFSIGGGDYNTILEITDNATPDVYDLELAEGDLLEVHEQIQFKNSSAVELKDIGVFGTPAGLRTVTGSNRVKIPQNSHIDFTQMGDLVGQYLSIDSGPDEGIYRVARVVSAKELELDAPMTITTVGIKGYEVATLYDADILPVLGNPWLRDTTDTGLLPLVGEYVTIFEAANTEPEGTFEVIARDLVNQRVQLSGYGGPLTVAAGTFTWVATDSNTPSGTLEQPFTLYRSVPKEVLVYQVASKAADVKLLGSGAVQAGLVTFDGGAGSFTSVVRGDRLEILAGVNAGVYPILSTTSSSATVYAAHPFSAIEVNVPYRVWAGVHGSRKMVTVGPFEGSNGKIDVGSSIIYRILRPELFRISSTEMQENVDESGLYYFDIQIESLGPGDDRNLLEGSRMVSVSGLRVDGYTYTVENNTLTFSMYEEVQLNFDRRFLPVGNSDLPENRTEISGRNLQISYETSTTVQLVNDLLRSDTERTVTASAIARHFLPTFLYTQLVYSGGSSTQVTGPEVEDYVNELGPLEALEVSDIEAILTRRGATYVRHPIVLVGITHDINRALIVDRSKDAIGSSSVPYTGSARTSSFFATLGDGLVITKV